MSKKVLTTIVLITLLFGAELALAGAKIIKLSGDVKVRRGLEETWQAASIGMLLEDIDTILTGADGIVVLQTADGINFELGKNSMLDISDLRKITEKELFLFLMSRKVQKIEPREGKTRLRIGNVSIVHGESKVDQQTAANIRLTSEKLLQEKNGAKALYDQQLYPNSIIKFHKILDRYEDAQHIEEVHLYLGRSFEAINHPGQAIDAYQSVIDQYQTQDRDNPDAQQWINEAQQAIDRLKSKNE
jgi:tetratricopeptide (TPR) repeat protein